MLRQTSLIRRGFWSCI